MSEHFIFPFASFSLTSCRLLFPKACAFSLLAWSTTQRLEGALAPKGSERSFIWLYKRCSPRLDHSFSVEKTSRAGRNSRKGDHVVLAIYFLCGSGSEGKESCTQKHSRTRLHHSLVIRQSRQSDSEDCACLVLECGTMCCIVCCVVLGSLKNWKYQNFSNISWICSLKNVLVVENRLRYVKNSAMFSFCKVYKEKL